MSEAEAYSEHIGQGAFDGEPPCPSTYCPCPDCREQHEIEIAAANASEDERDRTSTVSAAARADTLAFMAFIPIRRMLQQRRFDVLDAWDLTLACGLATLAVDLHEKYLAESA